MVKIKLLVADIDGTLVGVNKMIGPDTRTALEKLHSYGVKLGIASGRQIDQHLFSRAEDWGLSFQFDMFIGMNGGELSDSKNHIDEHYNYLSRQSLKAILHMMAPLGLNPFVYDGDHMLVKRIDEDMAASSERNKMGVKIAESDADFYQEEHAKIMFRVKEEQMKEVVRFADENQDPRYHAFRTQTTMLEFMDRSVSKGETLKKYCDRVSIPLEDVIAFGDMDNDNSMIQMAGIGVCLADGAEGTKEAANYVTEYSSEEDGVGRFLLKYIIPEFEKAEEH